MRRLKLMAMLLLAASVAFAIWRQWPRPAGAPSPAPRPVERPKPITITFVGDVMLASAVGRLAAAKGMEHVFAGVSDVLQGDDLSVANLECAVATTGAAAKKQFTFRANPALLAGLRASGIDAVSLANNHSLDYGREAFGETLDHLRKAGLRFAGAGTDLTQAGAPAVLPVGRHKVALVAASRVLPSGAWCAGEHRPGVASAYDPTRLLASIRAARAGADVVAVYMHWGKERAVRPQQSQRDLARRCIDAGADVVVGAHPHVLQGFEYHHGRLIAYSLGNFIFTNRVRTTAMLQTTFEARRLRRATVIPCSIRDYRPSVTRDPRARAQLLRSLEQRSFGARVAGDGALSPARGAGEGTSAGTAPHPRESE